MDTSCSVGSSDEIFHHEGDEALVKGERRLRNLLPWPFSKFSKVLSKLILLALLGAAGLGQRPPAPLQPKVLCESML